MEVFMKRIVYLITIFLALSLLSVPIFADDNTDYDKAIKYYNSGKFGDAVKIFKEYTEKKPDPAAYYRLGYALYELGQYSEANKYFQEAYLINPSFSPELVLPPEKYQKKLKALKRKHVHAEKPAVTQPLEQPSKEAPPKQSQASTAEKPAGTVQPLKPKETAVTPPAVAPTPSPEQQKVEPQKTIPTPSKMPSFPVPIKKMPGIFPGVLTGLMASFGVIFIAVGIAIYIYICLCIFSIAKKLNVPAAWTAWIPIAQIWPIVGSAGKAWWWILLLLIPIVGAVLYFYLWMCISENLGKNKWLGLLMLVPIINLIFIGMLAFSKTEGTGAHIKEATLA
jgi:hypothetical protein